MAITAPSKKIAQAETRADSEVQEVKQPQTTVMVKAVYGDMVDLFTGTRITQQPTPVVRNGWIDSQLEAHKLELVQ